MKKSVLRKVMAVALSATVLCSTGFTSVGQFIGTDVSVSAANIVESGKCGDNVTYTLDSNGTLTISGSGDMANYSNYVYSPFHYGGIQKVIIQDGVTSIGNYAFYSCTGLISIVIPDSMTKIGESAFFGCTGLTSIVIPDSVTYINTLAFYNCRGLTSIVIPNSVTEIGVGAFKGCTGLTSIVIPDSVTSIGDSVFYECTGLTSIVIPDSVTSIGNLTFSRCKGLTNITLPDSVTSMGNQAFSNCTGLRSITIPDNVTYMGHSAFGGCTGLRSITIGNGVTSIGNSAFGGCTGLTSINIGNGVTSICNEAFSGCTNLKGILIPNSVTKIGERAFYGCTGFTSIEIPDSVTSIGGYAFYGCTGFTSIEIPDSVTSIGSYAFSGCTGLRSITIGNGVTSISGYVFSGCENLRSIEIPDSVTYIYNNAFDDTAWYRNQPDGIVYAGKVLYKYKGTMPQSTKITILDSVTSINSYAFYGCTGLTSIVIPDSVTSIGERAFYGCTNLTGIVIPDSVTSIGECAFYGCTGLKSIVIPDSVTSIGNSAFVSCTGLSSIVIPDSITSIGGGAFFDTAWYNKRPDGIICVGKVLLGYKGTMPQNTKITIPDSVTKIGNSAFYGCTGLTSIVIPDSVTSIGGYAFSGCTGLTSIVIPDSVTYIGNNAFDDTAWYRNQPDGIVYAGKFLYKYKGTMLQNTKIIIPDSVTKICDYAFKDCTNLTGIVIPDSVTSIGNYAFKGCTGLTSIVIPDSVTSIYWGTFSYCTGLTSVTIGKSVTSISSQAFSYCTGLKSIVIPDSVTKIGDDAFYIGLKIIYGVKGSCAEDYANKSNIPFATLANYVKGVAPTCTENGTKDYYHNNFDGKDYEDVECEKEIKDLDGWRNIPATGHKYTEKIVVPTTTTQGYTLHTCSVCGDSYKNNYTDKLVEQLVNNSMLSAETIKLGETITATGKATGGTGEYLYNVLYKQTAQSKWTTVQGYKANSTVIIKPTKATTYDVCVKVKDSNATEVKKYFTVKVTDVLKNNSTLSKTEIALGDTITVNGKATGGSGSYQYNILYKQTAQSKWTTVQSYKANATVTIKPTKATTYDVCVKVKDSDGTEVKEYFTVNVTNNELKNVSTVSAETINLGESVTVNAKATGSTGFYTYAVYYKKTSDTKWTTAQDFKANNKVAVTPTKATTYDICVKVKDDKGTIDKKYFTVNVTSNELKNISTLSAEKVNIGESVTVNAKATGSTGFYTYAVYYKKTSDTKWTTVQDFKANNKITVNLTKAATYDLCVKVKDDKGTIDKKYFTVNVTDFANTSSVSATEITLGQTIEVNCSATGSTGFYQYAVYYKKTADTKWTTKQTYSSNNAVTIKPTSAATYDICVKVKDNQDNIVKRYFEVTVK